MNEVIDAKSPLWSFLSRMNCFSIHVFKMTAAGCIQVINELRTKKTNIVISCINCMQQYKQIYR